jgi:gliding motility-associated-like protein
MKKRIAVASCVTTRLPDLMVWAAILISVCAHSQQNNNWYFGQGAAISFNAGNLPVPHFISPSALNSNESCAAISDENGNLVFYTNGQKIYNKNHQVMPNGDGLMGHESTFQGAVILRQPKHDSIYYVFTADAYEHNFSNGYRYSIVNINKDNGLGEVVAKNLLLQSTCTERLTATKHANSIDMWILTNDPNSNTFRAWLLTCNGLQTAPVISAVGETMNLFGMMNIGSMKVSPDGKKLCQTHFPEQGDVAGTSNFAQLFDFDNLTGLVTNPKKIVLSNANLHATEFSPNSKLLYFTDPFRDSVEQVETTPITSVGIASSRVIIPADFGFYGIQLGPDGKIYLNQSDQYLTVITNPNVKGIGCLLQLDKISLDKTEGRLGLPFVLNDLDPDPNNFTYFITDSCTGKVQFTAGTNLTGNVQWLWDFGDGTTSSLQNPLHTFIPSSQAYQVKLKISSPSTCGYILISKYVIPKGLLANAYFDHLVKCDSNYVKFINQSSYSDTVSYLWNFGDGITSTLENPNHTYPVSGSYTAKLKIKGKGACAVDSFSKVVTIAVFNIQASPDQIIEEGQNVQLNVTGGGATFQWVPSTFLNNYQIANPVSSPTEDITYEVIAKNQSGCIDVDTVRIKVNQIQDIYVPDAFTPNNDGLNDIFKPTMGSKFLLVDFSIFSRWGQKIYSTSEKARGWNGKIAAKDLPQGVYVWIIRARNRQNQVIERKGSFLLMR